MKYSFLIYPLDASPLLTNQIKIILPFIIILFSSNGFRAQSITFSNNMRNKFLGIDSLSTPETANDSTTESVFENEDSLLENKKPELLPEHMSLMENFLWGEKGLTRKIGLADSLSPEAREHELGIRRTMLTAHQIGGFTTLALMFASDYFGQKVVDGQRRMGDTHQTFVTATIISYSITAMLAILSPPPLIRRDEESTTTIHKTLAWFHVAGMIATPILGSMIGGRRHFNINKAHFHQIAGYITTAIFASSMIVITF